LAAGLAQAGLVGRAAVSRLVGPPGVLRAKAVAAAGTDDQPSEQGPARTHAAPARVPRAVLLEALLIRLVLLPGDVGRVPIPEQDQPLLPGQPAGPLRLSRLPSLAA